MGWVGIRSPFCGRSRVRNRCQRSKTGQLGVPFPWGPPRHLAQAKDKDLQKGSRQRKFREILEGASEALAEKFS